MCPAHVVGDEARMFFPDRTGVRIRDAFNAAWGPAASDFICFIKYSGDAQTQI